MEVVTSRSHVVAFGPLWLSLGATSWKSFQNPSEHQQGTGEMKEAAVGREQAVIAHGKAAEVAEPREGTFNDPAPPIASQAAAVLVGGLRVVRPRRNDGLNVPPLQETANGVVVVPAVADQALGLPADRLTRERLLEERDLRRGRRVQVCSQRSTRAIDQYHPLGPLAALGFADFGAPFLAGAKLPSMKHSSQRIFWRSLSWLRKARHSVRSTPLSSHCRSRRQHVVELPYRDGSSLQGAPVHRIQRMPSKQRRGSARGRPPRRWRFSRGSCGRIRSHCASVRARHSMRPRYRALPLNP